MTQRKMTLGERMVWANAYVTSLHANDGKDPDQAVGYAHWAVEKMHDVHQKRISDPESIRDPSSHARLLDSIENVEGDSDPVPENVADIPWMGRHFTEMIFLGSGDVDQGLVDQLHDRLETAICELAGTQQPPQRRARYRRSPDR